MRANFLVSGAVMLASYAVDCHAQTIFSPSEMTTIHSAMIAMNSPNWAVRDSAFRQLRRATRGRTIPPEAQAAIIKLMLRTAHETEHTPELDGGDGYGEELGAYIEAVCSFHTPEAALALLDPEIINTGEMAERVAADAGPQMVGPITQQWDAIKKPIVHGEDFGKVMYASGLVGAMNRLAQMPLDSEQRAAIEQRLLAGSTSADQGLRYASVDGLKSLGDSAAKARLAAMAASDPYLTTPPAPRAPVYLVREAAQIALTELAKK